MKILPVKAICSGQTDGRTDRQTDRQTNRQTDRQTDMKKLIAALINFINSPQVINVFLIFYLKALIFNNVESHITADCKRNSRCIPWTDAQIW